MLQKKEKKSHVTLVKYFNRTCDQSTKETALFKAKRDK